LQVGCGAGYLAGTSGYQRASNWHGAFNNDGIVGGGDLAFVLAGWGRARDP
jgi:hypothetical protein